MKKSELKQLIREVITELSPETLEKAAYEKEKRGHGDKGENLRQVAATRREERKWNELSALAGKKWDANDTEAQAQIKNLLSVKLKLYSGVGKLEPREYDYNVFDYEANNGKIRFTSPYGAPWLVLFLGDNQGEQVIKAELSSGNEVNVAFDQQSRMKVINMFKNIGVKVNANQVFRY
jgi:hypothetical protein